MPPQGQGSSQIRTASCRSSRILRQHRISSAGRSRACSSTLSHAQAAKSAEAQQLHFFSAYHLTASADSLFACETCPLATQAAKVTALGFEPGA